MKAILTILLYSTLFSQIIEKQNNIEKTVTGGEKTTFQIKSAYISGLLDGRLYYYLKAWTEKQEFADSLYSDRLDYLTNRETIRQLDRFYSDRLMVYVPVVSAIIIVHMEAEQIPKKVVDLYIDQTKFWINKLTLDMEQEGMQKILQHKQDKYNRIKK